MSAFKPFRIEVPQAGLDHLRSRLARTRWPDELLADRDGGVGGAAVPGGRAGGVGSASRARTGPHRVACFPGDHAIRGLAELSNTITHWTRQPRGGHFASLQAPDLLVTDIRQFFRGLGPDR